MKSEAKYQKQKLQKVNKSNNIKMSKSHFKINLNNKNLTFKMLFYIILNNLLVFFLIKNNKCTKNMLFIFV